MACACCDIDKITSFVVDHVMVSNQLIGPSSLRDQVKTLRGLERVLIDCYADRSLDKEVHFGDFAVFLINILVQLVFRVEHSRLQSNRKIVKKLCFLELYVGS